MKKNVDYQGIFERYGGIMRTCELTEEGISYKALQELISEGSVEKVKYGYYQWQDEKAFSEAAVLENLFPEAIICNMSALLYYGYTDRMPGEWHIAVDNRTARNKFKMAFPKIKPHFIKGERLNVGVTEGEIDGIAVKIYDRERVICDCLRHVNTMDGEIFNTAIQRYIRDERKNAAVIMEYAKQLGVEKEGKEGNWSMAVNEKKDMGASVLARLKKQSRDTGLNYQSCLQLFAQEEFLRRLELSKYSDNLILKGGMFLYTLTKFEGRPTMDIDFMLRRLSNDIAGIKQVMEEICQMNTGNDFITIEVAGTEKITPEKEYPGVKTKLMVRIKNVRIPFSIDVGVDDVIIPGAVQREVCTRLEGFRPPKVYTYSLESTIAEKFDAILKRMAATSRMKDFYDIYYLSHLFNFDGRKLQEAIFQTLQHRGTVYERDSMEKIKAFEENEFLKKLWKNYNPGPGLEIPDFHTVLIQIEKFIGPVYEKIIQEDELFLVWSASQNEWKANKVLETVS